MAELPVDAAADQARVEHARVAELRQLNLNFAELTASYGPAVPLRDYATVARGTAVHFRAIESALLREIARADYVFGCVAWLTNRRVLEALATKMGVAIIVQKEDFLRPDTVTTGSWKSDLHRLYSAVPGVQRHPFDGVLGDMSAGGDPTCQAVRCVGAVGERRDVMPRSHHKFAVFCADTRKGWSPYAVWTGSFNWTENAVRSLENAVVIHDREIVEAFYAEFQQVAALSEPLDWSSEYVDPEWRIGT